MTLFVPKTLKISFNRRCRLSAPFAVLTLIALAVTNINAPAQAASLAAVSEVTCNVVTDTKFKSEIDLSIKVDLAKREAETASGPTQFFFANILDDKAGLCTGQSNNWSAFIDVVLVSSLVTSDRIFISGIYSHEVAPHTNELTPNSVEFGSPGDFDSTVNAVSYIASDPASKLGLPLPVFNAKKHHAVGDHVDIFSISMTPTLRLIEHDVVDDRYYFEELHFRLTAMHPVPLSPAFWFLAGGLGLFFTRYGSQPSKRGRYQ